MRRVITYTAVLAALAVVAFLLRDAAPQPAAPVAATSPVEIRGVDAGSGRPVADVRFTLLGEDVSARSELAVDADGRVDVVLSVPRLVRVSAPSYVSRVFAVGPGAPVTVPLTAQTPGAVSLRFGGDVMMGRRFYQAGPSGPALLSKRSTVADHARLLADVRPLLADADVTVVNLETPLIENPVEKGPRSKRFHPDKPLYFASAPQTAGALALAGVDVVDLANNHVYDALEAGLDSTIAAVEAAGLVHFGAGRDEDEAWRPAYLEVRGERIAFVGCTTVDGAAYPITYVAGPGKGGAARCEQGRLEAAIAQARSNADAVVFMLHGGVEYQQEQSPDVLAFSRVAAEAGASVVVDGHPHVIGGISEVAGVPIVQSMGNLLFDQQLWATSRSYLVKVVLDGGRAVSAVVDPLVIQGFRPVPATGPVADTAARVAAGAVAGPMLLGVGTSYWPDFEQGESDGNKIGAEVGNDLLWGTGSMEDQDTSSRTTGPTLWALGTYAESSPLAACQGSSGLRLRRSPVSEKDVTATTVHRQPVSAGTRLSLLAAVRQASQGASLEIRWYSALAGGSTAVASFGVPVRRLDSDCEELRFDVRVPRGVVALQAYVRLRPPSDVHLASELRVDDVRLVAWGGGAGRLVDTLGSAQDTLVPLSVD